MTTRPANTILLLVLVLTVTTCSDPSGDLPADATSDATETDMATDRGEQDADGRVTRVLFELGGALFEAPFPIESRRRPDGSIDLLDFPNPDNLPAIDGYLQAIDASPAGYSRNGAIFFPFDGPLDSASLPQTLAETTEPGAAVYVVDIDPDSPGRGHRVATLARFHDDAGDEVLRPPNLLTLLPYPGLVLRPDTLHAAVVTRDVRDAAGRPLAAPDALTELLTGSASGVDEQIQAGFSVLAGLLADEGLDLEEVAAATVFRTGRPLATTRALLDHAAAIEAPEPRLGERVRDYPTYCVIEGEVDLPIYQAGDRPYTQPGSGAIPFVGGQPVVQWTEPVRFALVVPKLAMPAAGFPLLVYSPGSGGAHTQLVDRGTFEEQETPGNGRGPAAYLADVGIASVSIEAPLTGPRHPTGSTAGLEFFNAFNLTAFRDNIRQAAAELVVLTAAFRAATLDVETYCTEMSGTELGLRFDPDHIFLHGHSTGATIGELVLAFDRSYEAGLFTGAGGSWIYNLSLKQEPVALADLVGQLLRLPASEPIDPYHPLATLFQMAIEPAEAMNMAPLWIAEAPNDEATHILLFGGLIDGYFLPRMINALAMAAELDLAGPILDDSAVSDLELVGGEHVALPAGPNRGDAAGYLLQFEADDFDGHYVTFELGAPKLVYRCFFDSLARTGRPMVPVPGNNGFAPCP